MKKIRNHFQIWQVVYLLTMFVLIIGTMFFCVDKVQAVNLTVSPVTSSYDNLIGATNARWTFTATTTGELVSGDAVRFLFPVVNNGSQFGVEGASVMTTSGITLYSSLGGQPLSNRLSNPSFENNTSSWSYSEGGSPLNTWARIVVTSTAKYGNSAVVISATSTNMSQVRQTTSVATSSLFSVSFWAKGMSESTTTVRLSLTGTISGGCGDGEGYLYNFVTGDWQCVAFASLSSSSTPYAYETNLSNVDFQRITFTTTSPATSTYSGTIGVTILIGGNDTVSDMEMILDAVQVEMGDVVSTFNLGGTPPATEGILNSSFPGGENQPSQSFIYGFVNTTIATGTAFSYTFAGINNPVAERNSLQASALNWGVTGGTLPEGSPNQDFTGGNKTVGSANAAVVRAGGNMIVNQNTNITASVFTTGTTNVTYTFTFTPTSSILTGEKIILNFPIAYNNLLNNISVSTTEIISQITNTTIASFTTSTVSGFANIRVVLVTAGDATDAGTALTIKVYGVTNPATAAVYGGEMGGPESKFTAYTTKDNNGVVDGSPFGEEQGDFGTNDGPPPTRAIHIGGTNNVNVLVYKQSGDSIVKLSDLEMSDMKVGMGCPDKGFFVGQKKLVTSTDYTYASYNNILDCNYIVNAEPNNKGNSAFYDDFLMPAQKQVPAIGGVTVTTSIVFGVPNASTTLMVTGGVSGQFAFVQAYSADFMSFSPIFDNPNCTGSPGFTATGTGWACLNLKSGQNWNFTLMGGEMGNSGNFTGADGSKYWPPTIPAVYIASPGHTNLGPYAYVVADKNLIVNIKKAGTDSAADNACIGVKRSGGGMFMGSQDMTCGISSKTFKVPIGSITVEVGLPGFGMPQEYPVAILETTTTKNIFVSQPTTYISVSVQDSAGNEINGAPVFAHGNGFGQGMTGSTGTTTIYVSPGIYVVEGFAPGLGKLESQTVTVPGSGGVAADFVVNTASLGTVNGRVFTDTNTNGVFDNGVDTPLSGVNIGAHGIGGTGGGNGTNTDADGNYSLYLPAGTYEIGGWSSVSGGFQAASSRTVTGGVDSTLNVPLLGQGTLHIEIQNASNVSPLFAGAFSSGTGRGNGTDSWMTSGTSKIADLILPAGTYEFRAGTRNGELGNSTQTITVGETTNVTIDANAVAPMITINGNVASGAGIANATVWASKTGGGPGNFSTQTDSDGNYSLQVPQNSSFRMGVKILGYIVNDISTSTLTSNITVDFALTAAGGTISGRLINASSTAISNAWVSAKKVVDAGQMDVWTGTPTDGNGSFSLNVDSGNWEIFAEAPCYQRSTGTTTAINTAVTTTLTAIPGCTVNAPEMQGFTPTTGGQMAKNDMSLDIPANALGTGSGTVSLSVATTTPRTAPNATALPNSVQRITASDSTGQSITTLNNSASLSITYNESDLPTGFNEADLQLGYFDETAGQWETVASTVDIVNNKITASINHFTDYGPIMPNVPTAPTGLTATASSTSEIDLSWTASSPVSADYYIVYATTTALTTFPTSTQVTTTVETSYSHTGLSASTTWYYKVAGYNTNGEGWNSDRANATTIAAGTAGVTVSETGVAVTEGSTTDTYTVVLDAVPSANVVVTVTESSADISLSTTSLIFTTSNWNTPQTITITAVDDSTVESAETATITHTASSSDENYNNISIASVTATITDNDTSSPGGGSSGSTADITPPSNTSVVVAGGVTSTINANITLTLAATDATQMMISNVSAFTSSTWETYSTVKSWVLATGAGTKTVYAKFKDATGNISTAVSDSIELLAGYTTTTPIVVTTTVPVVIENKPVVPTIVEIKEIIPVPVVVVANENSKIMIKAPTTYSYQPGEKLQFTYSYKNETDKRITIKIVRQLLNSKGKVIKSVTASKYIKASASFQGVVDELIGKYYTPGEYTEKIKITVGKVTEENSFKINVEKLKKKYFVLATEMPVATDIAFDTVTWKKIRTNVALPANFKVRYSYTNNTDKVQTVRMIRELIGLDGKTISKNSGKWKMTVGEKDSLTATQTVAGNLSAGNYIVKITAYDWQTNQVLAQNQFGFAVELR